MEIGYDSGLSSIGTATYSYVANSPLVSQIAFANSSTHAHEQGL